MSNGWGGADPTSFADVADYELGTHYLAVSDVTVTGVRIFGGTASTLAGRSAHIWSSTGTVLATVALPSTITPGWNTYALAASVVLTAGTDFWVTYGTINAYGFLGSVTYPVGSLDGNLSALGAGFNNVPGSFPDNAVTTGFFGVDVAYTPGIAGNQRPVAGLTVDVTGPLAVQANVTITDESPATCSVLVEWGDGTSSNRTGPGSLTHTYAAAGTYAVMATATDGGGLSDSAAVPVTVAAAPGALHPTSELVTIGWVKTVLPALVGAVATKLPQPAADGTISWASTGFVQVEAVGGAPDEYLALRMPAIGVKCWAVNQGSSKPPWGKANQLAEQIVAATYASNWRLANLPAAYRHAHVFNVRATEPRRVPDDTASYACFIFDLFVDWVEVPG